MEKTLERFRILFDLRGKAAVVTGAARGNGMAIANALCDAGARVAALDMAFGEPMEDCGLRKEIGLRLAVDITKEEAVAAAFAKIAEELGGIDILVNNAGIIYKAMIFDMDVEAFRRVLEVNTTGAVICTKQAVPYMRKKHGGRIINVSSSQAYLSTETYSAYAASKAALTHLTRLWGAELARDNILVNAICPSFVMTDMMKLAVSREMEKGASYEEAYAVYADQIPLKRILEPEELGNWVVFLCGAAGAAMTGSNISLTCGQVKL